MPSVGTQYDFLRKKNILYGPSQINEYDRRNIVDTAAQEAHEDPP
jgi:hypothetical protein